jgi:hypothetical protein
VAHGAAHHSGHDGPERAQHDGYSIGPARARPYRRV